MPFASELPLTNEDVGTLRSRLSPNDFRRTLEFLATLRVFEDDANTSRESRYYLAPFFTADSSRESIGGQDIAIDVLGYLDDIDALLASMHGSLREQSRLEAERIDLLALAEQLSAEPSRIDTASRERLIDYATTGNPYLAGLNSMTDRMTTSMASLTPKLRIQIATELLRALDKFGVPLTTAERNQANDDPARFVLNAPARIRAALANMVLGVRYATFVSGMTSEHVRLLGYYHQVRPDVVVAALPIRLLRAIPLAAVGDGPDGTGGSAPVMLRSVNGSTNGVCGLTTSCTVVLEYTELGARSALLSTRGASIMPAQFVGDVAVSPAAQVATVSCSIATLRSRLALPFGFWLLGDRDVLHALSSAGVCKTETGLPTMLASTLIVAASYRNLVFSPAQLSTTQRHQLVGQLQEQLDNDAGIIDRLGIAGMLIRTIDREATLRHLARSYYSRLVPRFPTELIAALVASPGPPQETTRVDFDGIAIACWRQAGGSPYLSACPDNAPEADAQSALASQLESAFCPQDLGLASCAAAIQAAPPDNRGYLWADLD